MRNASNLSSKVMFFLAIKEWIGKDLSFKVACEQDLNATSSIDLL
jgi:hypothetical protein